MSVSNTTIRQSYTGDGSTTTFAIPFALISDNPDHIVVTLLETATDISTTKTRGVDYTLSPDDVNPVNVVFGTAPSSAYKITVERSLPLTQPAAFTNTKQFQKEAFETALDRIVMMIQQNADGYSRSVVHPKTSGILNQVYPTPVEDSLLIWGPDNNLLNIALSEISAGSYNGTAKKFSYVEVTTDTTIGASDEYSFYNVNSPAASRTITLPSASAVGAGKFYYIVDVGNNAGSYPITVQRSGSDTIQGSTSVSISVSGQALCFVSNGVNRWHVNTIKQGQITSTMLASGAATGSKRVLSFTDTKTSAYTTTTSDDVVLCNASGAAFDISMFAVAASTKPIVIKKLVTDTSYNAVTIKDAGASTITTLNTPGEAVCIASNGVGWYILWRTYPSDLPAWTPTGSWVTNSTYTGNIYRNGKYLCGRVKIACTGAPTATNLTITLPSGLVIDNTGMTSGVTPLGTIESYDNGTSIYPGSIRYVSTTSIGAYAWGASGTWTNASSLTNVTPFTVANTDEFHINFKIPIVGWK